MSSNPRAATVDLATRHLFMGMTAIAIVMLAIVAALPRRFPVVTQETGQGNPDPSPVPDSGRG